MTGWVRFVVVVTLATAFAPVGRANAADGDPPAGFGINGIVIDSAVNTADTSSDVLDVTEDSAGRIVALIQASLANPGGEMVVRYLPDGSHDPSFGAGGVARIPDRAPFAESQVAIEGNGSVLITGGPSLLRLDADGHNPTTVSIGGGTTTGAVEMPDGATAVLGHSVTMFRPIGGMDTSYDGTFEPALGKPALAVRGVALGDSLVITVATPAPNGGDECNLVKLDRGGVLDTSFGNGGVLSFPGAAICDVAATPDDRLVLSIAHPDATAVVPWKAIVLPANGQVQSTLPFPDQMGPVVVDGPDRYVYENGTDDIVARSSAGVLDATFHAGVSVVTVNYFLDDLRVLRSGNIAAWGFAGRGPFMTDPAIQLIATSFRPSPIVVASDTTKFVPTSPTRILDTREGLGAPRAKLGTGGAIDLQITGTSGLSGADVAAVVLNLTATNAAQPGFVTAFPSGRRRPTASSLNLERAGDTAANLVTVQVGAGGRVTLFSSGGTDLVADVAGYYTPAAQSTAGRLRTAAPERILDTRTGLGAPLAKVPPGGLVDLQVTGRGPVPSVGVSAVVINVTADHATAAGFVTVWPTGIDRPLASNLNLVADETRPNLVIVPIGIDGKVSLFTSGGADLVADVAGWFTDTTAPNETAGLFIPIAPTRMLDTRDPPGTAVPPQGSLTLPIGSTAVVPSKMASAVSVNVTVTEAAGAGFVTAWPAQTAQPLVSNLNVTHAGQTIPNAAAALLGSDGVSLFTQSGAHLIVDLNGWYLAN